MNKFDKILGDIDASVNLAVKNLEVSKKFYEDTLGLTQIDTEEEESITFKSGNTTIYVYQFAECRNQQGYSCNMGSRRGFGNIVRKLKTRGVTFEHYDMPDMTLENDIHIFGDMKVAWFKDPDDNILNITSR